MGKRPLISFVDPVIEIVWVKKIKNESDVDIWQIGYRPRGDKRTSVLDLEEGTVGGFDGGGFRVTWSER